MPKPPLTLASVQRLQEYDWPGNVRELQHVIERAVITSSGGNNLIRTCIISGNDGNGIEIGGHATGVQVTEAAEGTNSALNAPIPNGGDGIKIDGRCFDDLRPHWFPWTMPFNMTGHPAVSMSAGFGRDGLPIGIQLVGRFRGDVELLRVAALFESSQDLLGRWPPT